MFYFVLFDLMFVKVISISKMIDLNYYLIYGFNIIYYIDFRDCIKVGYY